MPQLPFVMRILESSRVADDNALGNRQSEGCVHVGGVCVLWCVASQMPNVLHIPPRPFFRNRYATVNWVSKNADSMPPNLQKLMKTSTVPFVHELFNKHHKKVSCASVDWWVAFFAASMFDFLHGKYFSFFATCSCPAQGFKYIADQFLHDLGTLAKDLKMTNPHYIKCVKPNDIKFRPIDGKAAFNAAKTYRQLACPRLTPTMRAMCPVLGQFLPILV